MMMMVVDIFNLNSESNETYNTLWQASRGAACESWRMHWLLILCVIVGNVEFETNIVTYMIQKPAKTREHRFMVWIIILLCNLNNSVPKP